MSALRKSMLTAKEVDAIDREINGVGQEINAAD